MLTVRTSRARRMVLRYETARRACEACSRFGSAANVPGEGFGASCACCRRGAHSSAKPEHRQPHQQRSSPQQQERRKQRQYEISHDGAVHDDARCERRNLAEKPKREQLQQDDEKAQHDRQCELSQVHGDAMRDASAQLSFSSYVQSGSQYLAVTLALAIAPSPQIWGSKLPKSRNGHAGDSTSLHDPVIDLSRILLEHPQTGI
jgi:hypothetical protein